MNARPLSLTDLALSLLLILLVLVVSRVQRLDLERPLLIGTARTFLQLTVVGYVLGWVFHAGQWYWAVLFLGMMLAVAAHAAGERQERRLPGMMAMMALSIAGGSLLVLLFVMAFIVRPPRWYEPQYVIPLAGMIMGNAMTGAALAVERLTSEVAARRLEIEAALSLGATARQAAEVPIRAAVRAALMPSVNAMMVVGIVQLPGMMTGQILAGARPDEAVRYQILVMYMLAAAVAITSVVATLMAHRASFTRAHQLRSFDAPGA